MAAPDLGEAHLPRILVVGDNPAIHRDFRLALANECHNAELQISLELASPTTLKPRRAKPAYQLEHALSGMEGIQKVINTLAARRPFQLAFVDLCIPGMDGVEILARLWEVDPLLQVVMVTACADYSWDDLDARLGRTDKLLLLKKPFEYMEVLLMAGALTEKWFLARQVGLRFEAGADDLIPSPFSPALLRPRVEDLLPSRRKLQESFWKDTSQQQREPATKQADAEFLRRTIEAAEKGMSDFEFDVEALARMMFMSRRQLLRKLKAVVGCAPNVLIRRLRLKRAAELLKSSGLTVSEITYAVGFSDLKHFREIFREEYGMSPRQYARRSEDHRSRGCD